MNKKKLTKHVKLCRKNLLSARVVCCAQCPFEEEIIGEYPEMKTLFVKKRTKVRS